MASSTDLLVKAQKLGFPVTAVAGLLGFLASVGIRPFPLVPEIAVWPLEMLLLALGAGAGVAAVVRGEAVDRRRWEIVQEPLLTSGERQLAHREAERERRLAAAAFLTAPLALGYWLAYQAEPTAWAAAVAPAVALCGFFAGYVAGHLAGRRRRPPGAAP